MAQAEVATGTALIQRKLRFEMADANVVDQYDFLVTDGENLKVRYEGAGATRDLQFSRTALESARSHIVLSQGYAVSSDSPPGELPSLITKDLPPFLLSRGVFASLKKDGNALFKFEWSHEACVVSYDGATELVIVLGSKKVAVPTLHCFGTLHGCELWIADDEVWPLILKHEEHHGYYWKLVTAV